MQHDYRKKSSLKLKVIHFGLKKKKKREPLRTHARYNTSSTFATLVFDSGLITDDAMERGKWVGEVAAHFE